MRTQCIVAAVCTGAAITPMSHATVVYDGRSGWTGSNAFITGSEWADDLHLTDAGTLTSFTLDYSQSTSSSVTVRFYTTDATNTTHPAAGTLLATYAGIPVSGGGAAGTVIFAVPIPQQISLPADVWMSVLFNSQALLPLQGAPSVGTSDINRTTVPGNGSFNFNWPGNFPFVVEVDPVPAPGALGLASVAAIVGVRRRR